MFGFVCFVLFRFHIESIDIDSQAKCETHTTSPDIVTHITKTRSLVRIHCSSTPTLMPVYITGENGLAIKSILNVYYLMKSSWFAVRCHYILVMPL